MIYIFGGSFSKDHRSENSWVSKIRKEFKVKNFSESNRSNSQIFLDFLSVKDNITSTDTVIVLWNDYIFPYIENIDNFPVDKRYDLLEIYMKSFYNEQLAKEHYRFYLTKVKQILEIKNTKLIVLWAFPSNYIKTFSKKDADPFIDYNNYVYDIDFLNEFRPALIYFSNKEIEHLSISEQKKITTIDDRPNHIGDIKIHDKIYTNIVQIILNKKSGIIDLL